MFLSGKTKIAMVLPVLGFMSMGNQSCNSASSGRQMKKLVEVHDIAAQPLNLGAAGQFDFHWVINNQVFSAISETNAFTVRYQPLSVTNNALDASTLVSKSSFDASQVNLGLQGQDLQQYENWVKSKTGSYTAPVFSNEASCMISLPQMDLSGAINSFEMVGGGGITIGYNPSGSVSNVSGQLQAQIEYAQMNMTMNASDPLSDMLITSTTIDQKQTKTKINFLLSFLPFMGGFNYYYTTPLATVTKKALAKALTNIISATNKPEYEWYTRVYHDLDPELAIIGGTNMGLKKGDIIAIYNDVYAWEGEPCAPGSHYVGGAPIQPAAYAEIDGVGLEMSFAHIQEPRTADPVPGAKVKLYKTVEQVQAEQAKKK